MNQPSSRFLQDQALDISRLELAGTISTYFFLSVLGLQIIFCLLSKNRGQCSFAIWYNIGYLQIIHWVNLINIDSGSEFEVFFKQLSVIFRPFRLHSVCSDESINVNSYQAMQISSNGFINNAKETLLIYTAVMLFCGVAFIGRKYSRHRFFEDLMKNVKYSVIIRLNLMLFLDYMTFSMINMYFFTGSNSCSTANMFISVIFLIIGSVWIVLIPLLIKKKITSDLDTNVDVLLQPIQTIAGEFEGNSRVVKFQYYTLYLLYRVSLAFSLVNLSSTPTVQLFVIASFQVIISNQYLVFYLFKAKPFRYKGDYLTTLGCESLTLILIILFWVRSLNSGPASNYYLTIICVVTIWVTELVIWGRFILAIMRKGSLNEVTPIAEMTTKVIKTEENGKEANKTGFMDNDVVEKSDKGKEGLFEGDSQLSKRKRLNLNQFTVKTKQDSREPSRQMFGNPVNTPNMTEFVSKRSFDQTFTRKIPE